MNQSFSWVILIPIWGDSHIQMCANYLLPSLLAKGNLPAINTAGNKPQLRFLTTKPSAATLEKLNIFKKLADWAEPSFCFIDDLVNIGHYGFILTIAYERGIQSDSPQAQVNNSYIFLNGDFVLSNNCFTTLKTKLDQGYNAILSPSLRANEHEVFPILNKHLAVNDDVLDCSGRELVRITLDHLHPTVVGAMINNSAIGTSISHQYFALVNDDLLVARYFLLFMFCIRPENPLTTVTSHCDYSFVPEMCPSGNYTVIADSDQAFMMELSPMGQESSYIYLGTKDLSADAKRMQRWVTKEHADYSKNLIYFHSNDLPDPNDPALDLATNNLQQVLSTLYAKLNDSPRASHKYHPFWNEYLNILQSQGQLLGRHSTSNRINPLKRFINWCAKSLLGLPPFVTRLHYKHRDYLNCLIELENAVPKTSTFKVLYVCGDNKDLFRRFFAQRAKLSTDIIRIDDIVNVANIKTYDLIFVETNQAGFTKFARYVLNRQIPADLKLIVYIDLINGARSHDITSYLCLLNNRAPNERVIATHARQKSLYHESLVKFMREVYGNKNVFKMLWFFAVFACNAMYLIIANSFNHKPKTNNIAELSSLVLNFK